MPRLPRATPNDDIAKSGTILVGPDDREEIGIALFAELRRLRRPKTGMRALASLVLGQYKNLSDHDDRALWLPRTPAFSSDAANIAAFPSTLLRPGETYVAETRFRFSVD